MKRVFKFNDEAMCPKCGKSLDNAPARDFIVFLPSGQPSTQFVNERCGWCDTELSYYLSGHEEITIKQT